MRTAAIILSAIGIILFAGCKKPNHAPDTPAVPSGPSSWAVGVSYAFSSEAVDPDGDSVSIRFDWGAGDTSEWSRAVRPGDLVTIGHSWSSPGSFTVRAQSKDRDGSVSSWSAGLSLTVLYQWMRTFGGPGTEEGKSLIKTRNGAYVVAGDVESDFWLVKVDETGDTVWTRRYGRPHHDHASSVAHTSDGGYAVCGTTQATGRGDNDVWLVKTDSLGDSTWARTYGGMSSDYGFAVQETPDGGYIIGGCAYSVTPESSGVLLVKTDASGAEMWKRNFGGSMYYVCYDLQCTLDGGYIITGTDNDAAILLKTNGDGDSLWATSLATGGGCVGYCVQQTQDGGYVVTGLCNKNGWISDLLLVKTNAAGEIMWTRKYDASTGEQGRWVQQTTDGGFIVAGAKGSFGSGNADFWLLKTDANGDTLWTRAFGGNYADESFAVQQTSDGGYVVAGYTDSYGSGGRDVWVIKTDPNGEVVADGAQ